MSAKGKRGPEKIAPDLESFIVPIGQLELDPENVRKHGERSLAAIEQSLRRFGQQKNVVTYKGVVIAGNGTVIVARRMGWRFLASVEFEGTEEEARAYAIADNRTAELSEWNDEALSETLVEAAVQDVKLVESLGFTETEVREVEERVERAREEAREREQRAREREEEVEIPPTIKVTIVFDSAEDKAVWDGFRRLLKSQYPEEESDTDRVLAHVREAMAAMGGEL